jgi:hypothetical protein
MRNFIVTPRFVAYKVGGGGLKARDGRKLPPVNYDGKEIVK